MAARADRELKMRNLISAAIVTACVFGIGAPALAAPHMGAQQAPHMAAHQMQTSIHNGGGLRGHDHGHRPEGRHRHGISVPFGFFDSAPGPDETGVPPEDPKV